MVNPQREHGHTDIANSIVEQFCHYRLSGEEWQVLWVILRQTYGWNKKQDKISLSRFTAMTGMDRGNVVRALHKLVERGVIVKELGKGSVKNDTISITTYSFVKVYTNWRVVSKLTPSVKTDTRGSVNFDNTVVSKLTHSNTNNTNTNKTNTSRPKAHLSDIDFLQNLKTSIAYKHINIDNELAKMDAWLMTRPGRQKTRRFIVNWLNKIDRPITTVRLKPVNERPTQREPIYDPAVAALIHKTVTGMDKK